MEHPSEAGLVEIARCEPVDQAGVLALILSIQQNEFAMAITAEDQPDLGRIADFYQTGHGAFFVARSGGDVVGTIALKDIGDGMGALRKMFVASGFRGPPHRVATRLLEALLAHADAHDVAEILLGTTEAFTAAHRFYERHGFTPLSPAELPAAFPRMHVDTRFYRWRRD